MGCKTYRFVFVFAAIPVFVTAAISVVFAKGFAFFFFCRAAPYRAPLFAAISDLLLSCGGATAVRTLVMLMGGIPVESLKEDVRVLPKLKGVKIPRSVRSAIVKTLAKSSWFGLMAVFRYVKSWMSNACKRLMV